MGQSVAQAGSYKRKQDITLWGKVFSVCKTRGNQIGWSRTSFYCQGQKFLPVFSGWMQKMLRICCSGCSFYVLLSKKEVTEVAVFYFYHCSFKYSVLETFTFITARLWEVIYGNDSKEGTFPRDAGLGCLSHKAPWPIINAATIIVIIINATIFSPSAVTQTPPLISLHLDLLNSCGPEIPKKHGHAYSWDF